MANFNTGTATIDKELNITRGDLHFYQYIEWESPKFLEQSVCPEDFPHLRSAIEKVFEDGHMMCAYRVLRPDKSLHWVLADIKREPESNGELFVRMDIQDLESLGEEMKEMRDEIRIWGAYLDIVDEIFFLYNVSTDDFQLFMGGDKQKVSLFNGTLDEWAQSVIDKNVLDEKALDALDHFCDDLRQGSRHFAHELTLPNLVKGGSNEMYLLKGKTITDTQGTECALGSIYTIAKNSRRKKVRFGMDTSRDAATGLLNKQTVTDYIKNVIAGKPEGTYYLCVMDVDNFKSINDNFGHMFGDEVLVTVADILKECVGERGVVGRIGGDEMMIFLEKIKDRADLKSILRSIRSNVEWAYKGIRDDVHLSCSIGAAAYPLNSENYDDLFRIADKMLYRAKENGKNRYIIYTPETHGDVLDGTGQVTVKADRAVSRESKERLLLDLTDIFLHQQVLSIQLVLEETGALFGLSEANIFWDEPVFTTMHWSAEGGTAAEGSIGGYADNTKFRQLFNENNMAVINHTADLEFSCPEAYEYLNAKHVTSALYYRMTGSHPGYVTFFKREFSSRLWADSDIIYLNLIGKMIDLVSSEKR